jgi:hypothetical protein
MSVAHPAVAMLGSPNTPAGSMARAARTARRPRPSVGFADSLVRVWLSGCLTAGGRENESADSARGGNMGLSMVMVVALRFGLLQPLPVTDRQPGGSNPPKRRVGRF